MRTAASRARRVAPTAVWAGIVMGALAVHAAILGSVTDFGLFGFGSVGTAHAATRPVVPEDLKTGCIGDAILGSTARFSLCLAPWRSDTDACIDAASLDMWIDLSSCEGKRNPDAVAAVSMLEPKQTDKVTPIDPEPLIEMMKQPDAPKPPPPELQKELPKPPTPPPPPPPARHAQVVETAQNSEKEPENARFIADHNSVAEKQTVARGSVDEPMVAKSKPEELAAKSQPKEASIKEEQPDRPRGANPKAPDVPGSLSMRAPGAQHPAEVAQDAKTRGTALGQSGPVAMDGVTPRKGDGSFEQQQHERSETASGQSGAGGGAPDVPNLKPSKEVLERALGGGSVDHLEDVANGDETALNAKMWVHATFFNRMKRAVRQNWDPGSVWRRRDPTGQVYGFKSRVTSVRVALNMQGGLQKIVVVQPSGVSELDDEAVRAFHAAAPFVNPPKELANKDGLIVFEFGFYFEVGEPHVSWRVVRSI